MDELIFEEAVRAIAAAAAYPPTPQLRARVLDAIAADAAATARSRRSGPPPILRFAIVASIAAAVVGIAIALSVPSSRSAIADFFGIEGSRIEVLPTLAPGVTPTPFPTPAGIESYATPSSLDGVRRDFGFVAALPPGEAEPDAVYVADYLSAQAVILHYESFDLWEVRLSAGTFNKGVPIQPVFDKLVGSGTKIEDLTINGSAAAWISGGAHIVRYVDANGRTVDASVRTVARNTLVWHNDAFFYRLETDLPEAEAIRIANSLP
jgi:hypothetical protein